MPDLHVVTGAFGYSGRHIVQRLLEAGVRVRTLTNTRPAVDPFGGRVETHPLNFSDAAGLERSLSGAAVLHNTYWVRFNRGVGHATAVENTRRLFAAAAAAGVGRVVHVSITNASLDSPLSYFRGKAQVEVALKGCGMSYAILRPALLFGGRDVLINNIAWALRRFPVFLLFGRGKYRLQPIHVDDLAELAVAQSLQRVNGTIDAIGPETYAHVDLVRTIGRAIGRTRPMIPAPVWLGLAIGKGVGWYHKDIFLTRDEVTGLMAGLLCTDSPPAGTTRLSEWAPAHADTLGREYASELARR